MIIEIDGGRYGKLKKLKSSALRQGVKHLVLWDEDCQNHRLYGIGNWPAAYLIGKNGTVLWEGRPSKAVICNEPEQKIVDKRTGRKIRELVAEALKERPQGWVIRR